MKKYTLIIGLLFTAVLLPAQDVTVFPQISPGYTNSAVCTPDGKYVVSGNMRASIIIWDAENGRELRRLEGHTEAVFSITISADGRYIYSASGDTTIRIWERETGNEVKVLSGHKGSVGCIALSPDGKRLVSASDDETLKIWDIQTGRELRTLSGHHDMVKSAAYSPDGKRIVSGSYGIVRIWDAETGAELKVYTAGSYWVYSAAFSPDGKHILSGNGDGTIRIWSTDISSVQEEKILFMQDHSGDSFPVLYSPDGKRIIAVSPEYIEISGGDTDKLINSSIKVWDAETYRELTVWESHRTTKSLFIGSGGNMLVSGGWDNTVKLWDISTGIENARLFRTFSANNRNTYLADWRAGGKRFITSSDDGGGIITIWNWENGSLDFSVSGFPLGWYSPDGSRIICITPGGGCVFLDSETAKELYTIDDSPTFSPDGRRFISKRRSQGTIFSDIRNVENGELLLTVPKSGMAEWSPDGKTIAFADNDGYMEIYDTGNGEGFRVYWDWDRHINSSSTGNLDVSSYQETARQEVSRKIKSISWISGGERIAVVLGDGTIKVFDIKDEREVFTIPGKGEPGVDFSPDKKHVIIGYDDDTITIYDLENGEPYKIFKTLSGFKDVSYSPTGLQFVYVLNGVSHIWDIGSGREIKAIAGDSTAYSPDGKHILTDTNGTRLWDASTGQELAQFIAFTDNEWIVITPEGFYNASPNGDHYLNVRVDNQVFGIDQFKEIFYKPEAVELALSGDREAYLNLIRDFRIENAAFFLPPAIEIKEHREAGPGVVELPVSLSGSAQPVRNIRVVVNGRLAVIEETEAGAVTGELRRDAGSNRLERTFSLELDEGWNLVEVIAGNGYSFESRSVEIEYQGTQRLPNLRILAIGVNDYADPDLQNLSYAVEDARGIIESFKAQEGKLYANVQSLLIADEPGGPAPTRERILAGFEFLKDTAAGDMAVFFIAGHGVSDRENNFVFLPADAARTADSGVWENGISRKEINALLAKLLGQKLIFIDACHSAAGSGVDNNRLFRDLQDGSTVIFTSSKGNELSLEHGDYGHGLFTWSIMQGIGGRADFDLGFGKDGFVTMTELNTFVNGTVSHLSGNTQTPTISMPAGFPDFKLADVRE